MVSSRSVNDPLLLRHVSHGQLHGVGLARVALAPAVVGHPAEDLLLASGPLHAVEAQAHDLVQERVRVFVGVVKAGCVVDKVLQDVGSGIMGVSLLPLASIGTGINNNSEI